ncbi:carbohydrate binding domain-containing protein [Paenibacillus sp. CC-CFT747]|nr:carbohydrate binding domain-containing protein [Paenibacillus sp. CC-CFT747]
MNGNRLLAIALSAALVFPAFTPKAQAASDPGYVPVPVANGDFEAAVPGDGSIPGWTTTPAGSTFNDNLKAEVSKERSYSGAQSLRMIDNDSKASLQVFSSMLPVTEGKTYRFQTQAYVQAKSVRLYVHFKTKGSNTMTEGFNYLANTVGSWTKVEQELVAPPGAEYAQVSFYYGASGTGTVAFLDDVKLEEKTATSTLTLPYSDTSIDLGEPVQIGISQRAVIGVGADGKEEQYITTTGSPAGFTVVDLLTGKQKFSQRVEGATDTIWGMDRGSDGNIYFASTGKLYRYVVATQKIENLGTNPTGTTTMYDVKASPDGKIYGGTFHTTDNGRVYEYDIATGQFRNLGIAKEGEAYAIGLGVTDKYLYVGTGSHSGLVRYDRKTLAKEDLTIPGVTGEKDRKLGEVESYNGFLFIYGGDRFHVVKEDTLELIQTLPFQAKISAPNPDHPDTIYYKLNDELYSYNMTTNTAAKVESIHEPLPDTAFKVSQWVKADSGRFAGKWALYSMAAFGETFVFEPESGEYETIFDELAAIGTSVNVLEYNKGLLYMSGFQRGMSVMDTSTDKLIYNVPAFHQSEGVGFYGDAAYFGAYPGAKMYRLDMSKPLNYNEFGWSNPGLALDIADNQNRPYIIKSGGGKLFTGTFPASGFEGALSILEEQKDAGGTVTGVTYKTYPNLIPNQTIIGLQYYEPSGKLFGSTTVYGYLGSVSPTPPTTEGKVFVFNPSTGAVEHSFTPKVPGVTGEVKIIGDLSLGPDGLIWGFRMLLSARPRAMMPRFLPSIPLPTR